jgi:hypothetical protein
MPAFSDRISEDEARQLVSHVRGLGGRGPAQKAAPTDFERRFRELEAEMQELTRQFEEVSRTPGRLRR